MRARDSFVLFLIVFLITRLLLCLFIWSSDIGLMPDEAQYWTWSQNLDWGYYSKPPGIAWQIALGTSLFGNTEFGVRFVSLLLPLGIALLLRSLVVDVTNDRKVGWVTAMAFILSPIGFVSSLFATTDGGMIFFWLLALLGYSRSLGSKKRFLVVGLIIAVGGLWKWMSYTLWIPILAFELWRRQKDRGHIIWGMILSCVGLLPSVFWNMSHDWPTFRHVFGTISVAHKAGSVPNFFDFLLAGVAFISPGFFLIGLPSLFRKNARLFLFQLVVCIIWGWMLGLSCFRKMQGNWAIAAQTTFFIMVGVSLARYVRWRSPLVISAAIISALLQLLIFVPPYIGGPLLAYSPLKSGLGNKRISSCFSRTGYRPGKDFLFASRYQDVSQLWFYGPEQKKVYFLNLHHLRKNQFCYWPGMSEECVGRDGFFVAFVVRSHARSLAARARRYIKELAPYFLRVDQPKIFYLEGSEESSLRAMVVIHAHHYRGTVPQSVDKY